MILLYKGVSPISRGIRWATWSEYSHAAWEFEDGRVIEAWTDSVIPPRGSVRVAENASVRHTPGTVVDRFGVECLTASRRELVEKLLLDEVGCGYDFAGIFGRILRRESQHKENWFCSELVFDKLQKAGINLLERVESWKVDPGMIRLSPFVYFENQFVTV